MKLENIRKLVAKEAARLLYYRLATEYKFAKLKAAKELGVNVLPSNREVADELDALADLLEGNLRVKRLIEMRYDALKIMECLSEFKPKLIGSVWRGTARIGSDIDIIAYANSPVEVIKKLKKCNFKIVHIEEKGKVFEDGLKRIFTHIYLQLPSGNKAEIVVRRPGDNFIEICDIYGDIIKGLAIEELKEVLKNDPAKKFIPQR
ncbi:MAG: hypothetical protein DRJ21_01725 [Candidatus Methanomethylicota archaeon]|uniref:Polymerase nucleotidyl transferase domain-containing protein n=1 Tax=Thermoproteota archaeon TaxID=2056631 RepID=A0A497ETE2_9CREN|nr:MAG: hypothetical protein DRJ21_01725 [Candidatus Verstraetearchaeota archaeon]